MNQQREADLIPWKPNVFCYKGLSYVNLNRKTLRQSLDPRLGRCADDANLIIKRMINSVRNKL